MAGTESYNRLAWADQFQKPSVRELRDGLAAPARHQFDAARKHLLQLHNIREDLVWYGDCWKWTLEYRTSLSKSPLAVLIPCPHDLQLASTLDKEFAKGLPIKRMKRAIRDGLELAQEPFDTRWGVWSISNGLLDDLQDLIELKLEHLAKRVG